LIWRRVSIETVLDLVQRATEDIDGIDLLLFGSTVHHGRVVGDIDLWLNGPSLPAAVAARRLSALDSQLRASVDVIRPGEGDDTSRLDAAYRWCVATDGVVISGSRPAAPEGMTFTAIEDIYRLAVIEQAASVALHAAALTRAQAPAGVQYVEAALRLLARAQSRDHEEERLVRRARPRPS